MKAKVLVTGATGKTGRETTLELLKHGYPVRAMIHREDFRSQTLRDAGAETFVADMLSVNDMTQAMKGIQRAYFVCPWTPNQLDITLNFCVAAADNRVEHIVAMSQWLSNPVHPSMATRRTYLSDRLMSWLPDASHTLINVGFFADNYMALLEPIAQLGLMPMPLGRGLNAPVSNADIGRCVAAALMAPEQHAGKTYRPCGPELLSPEEIAANFSSVLKRNVKYLDTSERMFTKAARTMGYPTGLISQLLLYFAEYRAGAFAAGAPNNAVLHLTGREPERFEDIVRQYTNKSEERDGLTPATGLIPAKSSIAQADQTLANRVRAIGNFLKLLLTPAPNIPHFTRQQSYPEIAASRSALDYQPWLQTHTQPGAFGA